MRKVIIVLLTLVMIGSSFAMSERQYWIDTDTNFSGDDGDSRFREYYDEFDIESLENLTEKTFGDIELGEWENSYSATTGVGWTTSTDATDNIEGTNSDKLTMVSGDSRGLWTLLNLHIIGNETMRVTFWIKTNTTGVVFRADIYWQDWAGARESYNGLDLKAVPTTWTKYTLTPSNFSNWGGANNEKDQRFFGIEFESFPIAKDAHIHLDGIHLEWVNISLNGGSSATTYPDGHNTTENPTSKAYQVSNGNNESYTFITKDIDTFSYRPAWIELYLNITSFDYDPFRETEYVMIGSGLQNTTDSQTNFTGLRCVYNNATYFQAQVYLNGTWKSNIGNYSYNEWVHVVVGSVMLDGYNDRISIIIDDETGYLEETTDVNQTTTHGVGVLFHLDFNTSSVLVDDLYLNNHHDDTYNVDQEKISYYGKAPYPSDSGVLGGDGYKNFVLSDNYNKHIWRNHYVSVVSRNDDVCVISFNTSWNQTTVNYHLFDMDAYTYGNPIVVFDGNPIPGYSYTTFNTMDAEIFLSDLFIATGANTGSLFGAALIRYNFTTQVHSIRLLDPTMGAPTRGNGTYVPRLEVVGDELFISWSFRNATLDLMRWAIYDGSSWSYFNDTGGPTDGGGSYGCELVYINTKLYCLWTSNSGGYAYKARYDFTHDNWTSLGKLEEIGRHVYPAATVYKDRVWLATMWNGRWNPIHGTEYYDIGIFQMLDNGTFVGPPSYIYNVTRYFASPAMVVCDDQIVVVYNNYMDQSRQQQMGPSISIISQSPNFLASIDDSNEVAFRSYSFEGSFGGVDQNVTYLWDFDDGSTSTEEDPDHEFQEPGTYDVTLTVTDEYGATNSTTTTIHILSHAEQIDLLTPVFVAAMGVIIVVGVLGNGLVRPMNRMFRRTGG